MVINSIHVRAVIVVTQNFSMCQTGALNSIKHYWCSPYPVPHYHARGGSRIFLRRGAPLRNDVTDGEVKKI